MMGEGAESREERYEQWLAYVHRVSAAVQSGRSIALGPSPTPPAATAVAHSAGAPPAKVVYCAAHPDDESLSSALALRLLRESDTRVTNVAVTLGSDPTQRARRLRELECACGALGFALVVPNRPHGFEQVNLKSRHSNPSGWAERVEALRDILGREKPDIVFAPHAEDFNTTHVGTHSLAIEALGAHLARSGRGSVLFIETEFWRQLREPNLMVGLAPETVALQLMAASEHGGEMARNPFHLLQPCRLMDNVRRGSEVVGGQGAAAQPFRFAELYRVSLAGRTGVIAPRPGGYVLGPSEKISLKWLEEHFRPEPPATG